MYKKRSIPTFTGFCVIVLQTHREVFTKYGKRAITLQKHFFKYLRNFFDRRMQNVVPMFRSWGLNGVATIEITHIHTYQHDLGNTLKKILGD